MTTQNEIDDFLSRKTLAVVGASRDGTKYGSIVYRNLKKTGYKVLAVNPNAMAVDGDPCFPRLGALPETPEGAVLVVPPEVSEQIVREAAAAGIRRVWMQPGAESEEAVRFCEKSGMTAIAGLCIMTMPRP